MNNMELIEKLHNRERLYGSLLTNPCVHMLDYVKDTGMDMVFMDSEHIPNDRIVMSMMCHNYQAIGMSTFIRIPSPDPFKASQMLDGGVDGILVPYMEKLDDVRRMVAAVKYRPLKGEKLEKLLSGELELTEEEKTYLKDFNKGKYLFINIESVKGIENLPEILQIPGIDGIIVGPHDLSVSLGIGEQYERPEFDAAIRKIIDICKECNMSVGVHTPFLELQKKWSTYGMNIVMHSCDMLIYTKYLRKEFNEIRAANGEPLLEEI